MRNILHTDPIELNVGRALIPLVDERQAGDLLDRIMVLRQQAASELGLRIPPIRIRDDVRLAAYEYVVRMQGIEVARAEVLPDITPSDVVASHLMEILTANAADLLDRREVEGMVARLKKTHAALVESIVPNRISLGTLHLVLQRLLRDRVPVRDLVTILEILGPIAATTKDPETLAARIRRSHTTGVPRCYITPEGRGPKQRTTQKTIQRTTQSLTHLIPPAAVRRSIS